MEKIREDKENKILYYDDYAHHPEEIKATLETMRQAYRGKKLVCIFHPHTYSRTKALFDEFVNAFDFADQVVVVEVYGSAREKKGDISSKDIVNSLKERKKKAIYAKDIDEAKEILNDLLSNNQLVITMGAGDVWKVVASDA